MHRKADRSKLPKIFFEVSEAGEKAVRKTSKTQKPPQKEAAPVT